jgi:hypothetical protein
VAPMTPAANAPTRIRGDRGGYAKSQGRPQYLHGGMPHRSHGATSCASTGATGSSVWWNRASVAKRPAGLRGVLEYSVFMLRRTHRGRAALLRSRSAMA